MISLVLWTEALHLNSVCICRRPQIWFWDSQGRPPGVILASMFINYLGKRTSVCWWHSSIRSSRINVGKVHFCKATDNLKLSVSLGEKFRFHFVSQCCSHALVTFRHKKHLDKGENNIMILLRMPVLVTTKSEFMSKICFQTYKCWNTYSSHG